MKNFAEKIRSLLSGKEESQLPQNLTPFEFIKSKKAILRQIVISKESGKLLGVYCKAFGEGMFLTGVEDMENHEKEEVITFNQYDMSGHILSRTRVSIGEIQMVCPFDKTFINPVLCRTRSEYRQF
jgi:hypothetical protein